MWPTQRDSNNAETTRHDASARSESGNQPACRRELQQQWKTRAAVTSCAGAHNVRLARAANEWTPLAFDEPNRDERRRLSPQIRSDQHHYPREKERSTPRRKKEQKTPVRLQTGFPQNAACVQRSNNSRNSAIHIAYRSSLRSSSLLEPRHSPL